MHIDNNDLVSRHANVTKGSQRSYTFLANDDKFRRSQVG